MITKSGYLYTVSYQQNGEDKSMEIRSFDKLTQGDIVVRLIDDSSNINISNLSISEESVVWAVSKSDFLNISTKSNRKTTIN